MTTAPTWVIPAEILNERPVNLDTTTIPASPTVEAYAITSLCATGNYEPQLYGIPDSAFTNFPQVHAAASRYQSMSAAAPPLDYLRRKFPTFPTVDPISPDVAASDLITSYRSYRLREGVGQALPLLADDPTGAVDVLAKLIDTLPGTAVAPPVSASDINLVPAQDTAEERVPVPGGMLTQYTNGIAPGRLWYIGARYGVGKTWQLCRHALAAAEGGWTVHFFSLEMPKVDMAERLRWVSMGTAAYTAATPQERAQHLAGKFAQSGGDIFIHDPSSGVVTADTLRAVSGPRTIAIVDYLGLMRTRGGSASVEDWRTAATITNELREVTLATSMPVLAAVQLSKDADRARKLTGAHISQTDFAGMDADLIYLIGRPSSRVRKFYLDKNRHGADKIVWHTKFDVTNQSYEDISTETAQMMRMADEEAEEL